MSSQKGDRVYSIRTSSGGYAEFATVDERLAFPLPDKLTFLQGAACGVPYFTAYKALHIRWAHTQTHKSFIHSMRNVSHLVFRNKFESCLLNTEHK